MRSLDRNRVFDTKELEQLREDTYTVLEQAITVSEQYNEDRDQVMNLFDRVPAEAKISGFPRSLPTDFVYPEYADQQKKCNDIFENILCYIPKFDKEAADANEELIREIKATTRAVEELRELLKTGDVRLSVSAFEAKLKHICGPDFSEEEKAKMKLEEQKQADIEELCLLLSYEKDLTGSEKIHRDTLINRLFEEGDISKMRAVEEKLSKKGNSKWTQSERSFNERVLRYEAEKEKAELNTIEGTGDVELYAEDKCLSEDEMKANAEYFYNDLKERGWSTEAICAVLGNFEHESTINPGRWQVGKDKTSKLTGFGLVQWTPATDFLPKIGLNIESAELMANNNPQELIDLELQYFVDSIKAGQGQWFGKNAERYYITEDMKMPSSDFIISTADVGDLSKIYHAMYVRSADTEKMVQGRVENAQKWYEYFNK